MATKKQNAATIRAALRRMGKTVPQQKVLLQKTAKELAALAKALKGSSTSQSTASTPTASQARKQAAQGVAQARQQQAQHKASGRKGTKKVPKATKKRANALTRAIKDGRIQPVAGYKSVKDAPGANALERNMAFVAAYKGVVTGRKKKKKKTPASVKSKWNNLDTGLSKKWPYYLSKGYIVGGGPRGQGIIRKISGAPGVSFHKLSDADKKKVVAFLNGKGQTLRGRGAPKTAKISVALKQTAADAA